MQHLAQQTVTSSCPASSLLARQMRVGKTLLRRSGEQHTSSLTVLWTLRCAAKNLVVWKHVWSARAPVGLRGQVQVLDHAGSGIVDARPMMIKPHLGSTN